MLGVGRAEAEVGWLGQVHQEPGLGERTLVVVLTAQTGADEFMM